MTLGVQLTLFATCVLLQGFFSGSEIALVSADRLKLRGDAGQGSSGAKAALSLLDRPAWLLGTCLVGTNLCLITAGTLGATMVSQHLGLSEVFAALFAAPLTLTLGEMVPKALYQHHADRLAPLAAIPLRALARVLAPLLWVIERFSRLLGGSEESETAPVSREEIRLLLDHARDEAIKPEDKEMIRRVFAFTEAVVRDVMVPLIEVVGVPHTATCAEAARRMMDSGHSRVPVFQERVDRIVGLVLHQDLLDVKDWTAPVSTLARPPLFVPETKPVDQLFAEMRRSRQRLAVAVDEYGGAVGIVTAEDLLEEIVGDIEDESDRASALVRRAGDREWVASGRAEREHLEQACGLSLPDGDYETVAGYVLDVLGRVPRVGERVTHDGFVLTVNKASDRAIVEVAIRQIGAEPGRRGPRPHG